MRKKLLFIKFLILLIIVMSFLTTTQTEGQEYEIQRDYETIIGSWTTLTYTPTIYLNYPEFYPLELKFSSLGELPEDLIEYYNYSNTVFIGHFIISSSLDSFDNIDRERDNDELIGLKPLELSFELSDIPLNLTSISIEVRFIAHNSSLGISSDVYDLEIKLIREANIGDFVKYLMYIAFPIFFFMFWFILHRLLNKKFLDNISAFKVPYYLGKYLYRKLKRILTVLFLILIILIPTAIGLIESGFV